MNKQSMPLEPIIFVVTSEIKEAVKGHEAQVLDVLGIEWQNRGTHCKCPYPEHGGENDWRWDDSKAVAYCTCAVKGDNIIEVLRKCESLDFEAAKVMAAELIGRTDLIRTKGNRGPKMDAVNLLRPLATNEDRELPRAYLSHRLNVEPADVFMPATKTAGWRALPYFDPPAKDGKPAHIGDYPACVFETVAADGRTHAHRIYVAPEGAGKADLGINAGQARDPKKSARVAEGDNVSGRSVLWGDPQKAEWILLAEGIETAAAVAHAFRPEIEAGAIAVAAAISTAGVQSFRPYEATKRVTVAADRDEAAKNGKPASRAGERAAREFGARQHGRITVDIALPGISGSSVDWLDILRRDGAEAVRAGIEAAETFEPIAAAPDAVEGSKPSDPVFPTGFRMLNRGLVWADPNDPEKPEVMVSGKFEVLAETRDDGGKSWGVLLGWADPDGRFREWAMPRAILATDGADVRKVLLDGGLYVGAGPKARHLLTTFLTAVRVEQRARAVPATGWQGSSFVMPDATLGKSNGERAILQMSNSLDHAFAIRGDLVGWQTGVARFAIGNSRLVLAISTALAAALVGPCGEESGGVHFRGPSSIGKTTALAIAGSVWGGDSRRYVRQWRATANGLEGVATAHNDALLCLDELAQITGREAGDVAYMLANGAGKNRASRDATLKKVQKWRLLFLSSGEISLADKIAEDGRGKRQTAGQKVRIVDVLADTKSGFGLFEKLHGFPDAGSFAKHLVAAANENYGTAARAFIEAVAPDLDALPGHVKAFVSTFLKESCPADADGQVKRVAGRFGLIAAAGEIATGHGILPWAAGEAVRAAKVCLAAWIEARGGTEAAEMTDGVAAVRAFLSANGVSRFLPAWEDKADEVKIINLAGFRKKVLSDEGSAWDFFVTSEAWPEIAAGLDPKALAEVLAKRGFLLTPEKGPHRARVTRVPGHGTRRLYHISSRILEGVDA